MIRASTHQAAGILGLASVCWACGCGPTFETGAVLPDGGEARLTVLAPAEVTITNQGSAVLGVTVGWGAAGKAEDDVPPGVARWWTTDGPRWFRISNHAGKPVAVTCRVKGADASFEQPPR